MSSPSALLSIESLTKRYGLQPLFENLSFTLVEGDRVGLVGPNGSGKTTLLKILAGLEDPDAGSRALRRGAQLGYVPQDPTFPENRTVEELLGAMLPGAMEQPERLARIRTTLGRAGLGDPRQPVAELSAGWRKRLVQHLAGRASRYTRAHLPVRLVWTRRVRTWSGALSEEHRIKRLSRSEKAALVRTPGPLPRKAPPAP